MHLDALLFPDVEAGWRTSNVEVPRSTPPGAAVVLGGCPNRGEDGSAETRQSLFTHAATHTPLPLCTFSSWWSNMPSQSKLFYLHETNAESTPNMKRANHEGLPAARALSHRRWTNSRGVWRCLGCLSASQQTHHQPCAAEGDPLLPPSLVPAIMTWSLWTVPRRKTVESVSFNGDVVDSSPTPSRLSTSSPARRVDQPPPRLLKGSRVARMAHAL